MPNKDKKNLIFGFRRTWTAVLKPHSSRAGHFLPAYKSLRVCGFPGLRSESDTADCLSVGLSLGV